MDINTKNQIRRLQDEVRAWRYWRDSVSIAKCPIMNKEEDANAAFDPEVYIRGSKVRECRDSVDFNNDLLAP